MLGWLAKKGENPRIYMCIKEIKWDLEKAERTPPRYFVAVGTAKPPRHDQ